MAYPLKLHLQAFTLYCQNKSKEEIARQLGISKNTILAWHHKEKWDEQREKAIQKAVKKTGEKLAEIKARQIKLSRAIQGVYTQKLQGIQKGRLKNDLTATDADRAMKHELLLAGEVTSREELRGGLTFTFRVETQ